jgi:uncharacterized delta-60 repeat protein
MGKVCHFSRRRNGWCFGRQRGNRQRGGRAAAVEALELRRLLSAGQIDGGYASGGSVTLDFGGDNEAISQLLTGPNGKIYGFGQSDAGGNLAVARFNANGSVDSTFGTGGKVVTSIAPTAADQPGAIAVDGGTGRFAVVYGDQTNGGGGGVAMFTSAGALDKTFNRTGLLPHDSSFVTFRRVGFQSDGHLIIAGTGYDLDGVNPTQPYNPSDYIDPVLVREYDAAGKQVTTFGTGTKAGAGTTALTQADDVDDMEIMPDGRIVVATHFEDDTDGVTRGQELFRLTAGGKMDTSYGGGSGSVVFGSGDVTTSQTLDMDVMPDGSAVVLSGEGTLNFVMHKFSTGGAAVSGFVSEFDRIGRFPSHLGVAADTGDIFLSDSNGAVVRYDASGHADYTYGVLGVATAPGGESALVNANGTVLVGGTTAATADNPGDWQLTRLQNGAGAAPRPTLNSKGTLVFHTSNAAETIRLSIRTRDGKLILRLGDFAQSFTPSKVKRIAIYAGAGNDTITIGAGVRGTYVEAGDGNDTITGGSGGDVLLGDGGADKIYGNDGDDILLGGDGDDYLLGGAGKDDLFGDAGVDTLSGAGGNDRLFGGAGADQILGGAGSDSSELDAQDTRSSIETVLN